MTVSQILRQAVPTLGLTLAETQLEAFELYGQALIDWNQRINLTRITEPAEIATKHFLDSLSTYAALTTIPLPFSLIDVGSGAGFPGLPLKIVQPEIHLVCVEATQKKTRFLQHITDTLHLSNTTILTARAEDVGQQPTHREQYDVATARAVAALPTLIEYLLPLLKVGGIAIAQKGQDPTPEIEAANTALDRIGGQVVSVIPVELPNFTAERHLVVIKKMTPTPKNYPRRPGLPTKKPL